MLKKLLFIIMLLPTLLVAQHTIKGTFSPADEFKWLVLYKITPTSSDYIGNSEIKKDGSFSFELDSLVSKGMYRLVYALPQDEYSFDIIYSAKEDIRLTFNKETGIDYQSSIENTLVNSYTYSMSLVSQSIGNFFREQSTDTLALVSIFKTQKETQVEYEKAAEGTIASEFIKANKPYIPDGFEDIKTYINNLKLHFFDYVDFNNETLQSSNFLVERILNYVFGMTSENEDDVKTYKKNIDEVVVAMKAANPVVKKILLEVLWQQMVDTNFDAVANYISDVYLIDLAQSLNDEELVNGLKQFKSVAIGQTAQDFSFEIGEDENKTKTALYDLDVAQQYVVVFWSSTCSHCLAEIPELQAYVKTLEKDKIKVIAIGLEDEPTRWESEILKYPEFIHVLGLGKWEHPLVKTYNVTSTPSYFVLDKDKKIIAKPYDFPAFKKLYNE